MLYMSGGGVQIFSMGIVMVFLTLFKNIARMNTDAFLCLSVCIILIFQRSVCSILIDVI